MSLLGVANGIQIPYAGAFMIELHEIKKEFFVRLLYRNDSSTSPYVLKAARKNIKSLMLFDGLYNLVKGFSGSFFQNKRI